MIHRVVVGSDKLKTEGVAQEAKGDAQKAVGDAKNAPKDAVDKTAAALKKPLSILTFYSQHPATLTGGLRITPAFLESRRRSQPGGGFLLS